MSNGRRALLGGIRLGNSAIDSMVKKNKEIKMKPEQKKIKQMTNEKGPKGVPTPPRKKTVWKQKGDAPKSTSTSPKSNKMVWKPKKVQSSASTSPVTNVPSSSKK